MKHFPMTEGKLPYIREEYQFFRVNTPCCNTANIFCPKKQATDNIINTVPIKLPLLPDMNMITAPNAKIEPAIISNILVTLPIKPKTMDNMETILLGINIITL